MKILEDLVTPNFEADKILPTEEDFREIADAYADYKINGKDAAPENRPWKLAQSVKHDNYKAVRRLITAAIFRWKAAIGMLKIVCANIGYTTQELQALIRYAMSYQNKFEDYYNTYCEPVFNDTYTPTIKPTASTSTTKPQSNSNIKVLANQGATFCRIVAYDPKYTNPVRRHVYLTKKQGGSYRVSIGSAEVTSWFNGPLFDSVAQAENFIKNIHKATTKTNPESFDYSITDKPIKDWKSVLIGDLSNCVLVNTDCGPAYIHRKNQYCVEDLSEDLVEDIEKHNELNPVLFENNKLKDEIREKCLEIVDVFLEDFEENSIDFKIKDIIITGSNASYNYTKDSDVDIHIVADTSNLEDPNKLYPLVYDAYKSLFNKRLDIKFYDIPVEVYVETQETPLVSNGIYSIKNNEWVKEPEAGTIPEIDYEKINKAVKPWENRYKTLIKKIDAEKDTDEAEIEKYITELYKLRHQGLASDGEYSIGNLVFKEIRNKGYLDNLKDLKNKLIGNKLSILENYTKHLNSKEIQEYRQKITQLIHSQPIIQPNGLFEVYNIKESDLPFVISILGRQDFIEYIQKSAEKLDFSKLAYQGLPSKRYKLVGQIRI